MRPRGLSGRSFGSGEGQEIRHLENAPGRPSFRLFLPMARAARGYPAPRALVPALAGPGDLQEKVGRLDRLVAVQAAQPVEFAGADPESGPAFRDAIYEYL